MSTQNKILEFFQKVKEISKKIEALTLDFTKMKNALTEMQKLYSDVQIIIDVFKNL